MNFLNALGDMHNLSLLVLRFGLGLCSATLLGALLSLVFFGGWSLQASTLYDCAHSLSGGATAMFAFSLFGALVVEDLLKK